MIIFYIFLFVLGILVGVSLSFVIKFKTELEDVMLYLNMLSSKISALSDILRDIYELIRSKQNKNEMLTL